MALSGRGWYPSADTKETVEKTTKLAFASQALDDGDLQALKQESESLVSLELTSCTFSGENPEIADLPVLENAASLVTLVCTGSATMNAGEVPATWSAATELKTVTLTGNSWTGAEVGAFLVSFNAAVQAGLGENATSPVINVSSNAAPSGTGVAAAISALEGNSPAWTVTKDA